MIIRDYRELTSVEDRNYDEVFWDEPFDDDAEPYIPEKNSEEEMKDRLTEVLELFRQFPLKKRARDQLEAFFRFVCRSVYLDDKPSYNFMIHCESEEVALRFVNTLDKAIGRIDDSSTGMEIMTERELLADRACGFIDSMEDYRLFVVCECLTKEEFEPDISTSRAEDIARERKRIWQSFLKACESTPQVHKILVAPEPVLRDRFRNNEHLYFRIFREHLYIEDITEKDVQKAVLDSLKEKGIPVSEKFAEGIKQYIQTVYPKADLRGEKFINDLLERILTKYYSGPEIDRGLLARHVPYYRKEKAYGECVAALNDLVGLKRVKEAILEIPYMLRESKGSVVPALHMAFVGSAGTGKTVVAERMADMLYAMGVIRQNKVIKVSALDLLGRYIGHTSRQTHAVCERAYGGVLFIDEAYLIASSPNNSGNDSFRKECVGTLIQEMENNRDRLVVIFAGYPKEMDAFLHESNSGLGSRLYKIIPFDDYTDDELIRIFTNTCKKENYSFTRETIERVRLKLTALRYSRDFGNARTVRNVFVEAKIECERAAGTDQEPGHAAKGSERVILPEHIKLETSLRDYPTVKAELDAMVGLENAKKVIERAIATCRFTKESKRGLPLSNHMLFLGNAGTGKSTVAKLFCEMLFSIGVSKSPNCVSVAAGDLMRGIDSVNDLKKCCVRASGGVLFIDEAYLLQANSWLCHACITVLLNVLEKERDNITVILAGYEQEMDYFLSVNQGLKSRFPVKVFFDDYTTEQLEEIFVGFCRKQGFTVEEDGMELFRQRIEQERARGQFGNARSVRNIFEQTYRLHATNFMNDPIEEKRFVFTVNDFEPVSSADTAEAVRLIGFRRN